MTATRKTYAAKCAVILAAIPVLILAHSSGPDPRKTGAPGDTTCNQSGCHLGTAVNGGGGNVAIKLAGDAVYVPGQKQRIQVVVTDSAARVYGFQATSRPDGSSTAQAGTFSPIDAATFVICEDGSIRPAAGCRSGMLEFIEQAAAQRGSTFSFDWTAPSSDIGKVTIYVAANAANGDGTERGDHIYTTQLTLTAGTSGGGNTPTVTPNGVTDAMNFQSGLTPSSWISIFGTNLSTTTRDWTGAPELAQGKLPTSLDGVSVTINNIPAAVYFVSPGQVNVLSPAGIGTGASVVVVKNAAGQANATMTSQPALPAFYAPFADAARNLFVTAVALNGDLVGKAGLDPRVKRAPQPGETVILFGTGFGETSPAAPTDSVFSGAFALKNLPVIQIGGLNATVVFGGIVSPGLYQFNLTIPTGAPDGDLPVKAIAGSVSSAGNVRISVKK